jgi:hypothetical protein
MCLRLDSVREVIPIDSIDLVLPSSLLAMMVSRESQLFLLTNQTRRKISTASTARMVVVLVATAAALLPKMSYKSTCSVQAFALRRLQQQRPFSAPTTVAGQALIHLSRRRCGGSRMTQHQQFRVFSSEKEMAEAISSTTTTTTEEQVKAERQARK